jgi:hypothetical protein
VKAIARRLCRLEGQFGPEAGQPRDYFRLIVVVSRSVRQTARAPRRSHSP